MRLASYIRVSTADQADMFGPEVQANAIYEYAAINGDTIEASFSDLGESGSNGLETRIGLAEAIAFVKAGHADALIVHRLDRFSRDLGLQEALLSDLGTNKDGQFRLRSATPGEDDLLRDDPTRVLMRQLLGAVAQYEKAIITARMSAGRRLKMAQGGYGGGAPPYGYTVTNGILHINEDEQRVLDWIKDRMSAGKSQRAILALLHAENIPARSGRPWSYSSLRKVMARVDD